MGSVVGEVVEIDGSIMEGGGQILRMSVGSFKVRTQWKPCKWLCFDSLLSEQCSVLSFKGRSVCSAPKTN